MEDGIKQGPGRMEPREVDELSGADLIDCMAANSAVAMAIKEAAPDRSEILVSSEGQFTSVTIVGLVRICLNNGYVVKVELAPGACSPPEVAQAFQEWSPASIACARIAQVANVLDAAERAQVGPPINVRGEEDEDDGDQD